MNRLGVPPIPSFDYPGLARSDDQSMTPSDDDDFDQDDAQSLQSQFEDDEGQKCKQSDWSNKTPGAASIDSTSLPQKASESSKRVNLRDPLEGSSAHHARVVTQPSEEEVNPSQSPRSVAGSVSEASEPFNFWDSDESSIDETPPASLTVATAQDSVTPSPPRRSERSKTSPPALVDAVTSSPKSKRSRATGSQAPAVSKKKSKAPLQHTLGFEAKTAEAFNIPVHTLILGTHPDTHALELGQYYGNPMNAFWWIVGDCLGFRRAEGVKKTGQPYKFTSELRPGLKIEKRYETQLQRLCCKGFALWNTLYKCSRRGSLDSNITSGTPNDVRKWCQDRPSIRRIVFAFGKSGFNHFAKYNKDWILSGELVPSPHKASQEVFEKYHVTATPPADRTIECIVAAAVSPSFASMSYSKKRDFWEESVFKPGLEDFEAWETSR